MDFDKFKKKVEELGYEAVGCGDKVCVLNRGRILITIDSQYELKVNDKEYFKVLPLCKELFLLSSELSLEATVFNRYYILIPGIANGLNYININMDSNEIVICGKGRIDDNEFRTAFTWKEIEGIRNRLDVINWSNVKYERVKD